MSRFLSLAVGFCLLVAALGCGAQGGRQAASNAAGGEVLLLAAASTNDAVAELARLFESQTGAVVRVSPAGSNALANQILSGAPGDVFLSASEQWADAVVKEGYAVERRALLSNRLVIIVPLGNPAGITSPMDLLGKNVARLALAGEKVPAGTYAEQVLRHANVYETLVKENRIARGQDVRLTLGYVEAGEAEAGIVYATDARASGKVEVVHTFAADSHEQIAYPLVLLKSANSDGVGRRFYEFLLGDEAAHIFEKHGFTPLRDGRHDDKEPQ